MSEQLRDRVILALDVPTVSEAMALVNGLHECIGSFKVGLELLHVPDGLSLLSQIKDLGASVFLDGKYHDIPSTVGRYSAAAVRLGVGMFNVHVSGGRTMMETAVSTARQEAAHTGLPCPLILGVTVLTSIGQTCLNDEMRVGGSVADQVVHLARLAQVAGLDGVIASPHEIEPIKGVFGNRMLIVTPGVRPVWASVNDQKRVMTPGEAIRRGATRVVIGRPIITPPTDIGSPLNAAKLVLREIAEALA